MFLTAGAQHEERRDVEQQVQGDVGDGQQRRPGAVAAARRRHAAEASGACDRVTGTQSAVAVRQWARLTRVHRVLRCTLSYQIETTRDLAKVAAGKPGTYMQVN